jgi:5-methylcytosine-specific restriction endonuclease McrA
MSVCRDCAKSGAVDPGPLLICCPRDGLRRYGMNAAEITHVLGPRPRSPRAAKAVVPTDLRWEVWERDDFTCQHCGSRRRLSIDHKVPESKGGTTTLDNLQTLCSPCNSRKWTR